MPFAAAWMDLDIIALNEYARDRQMSYGIAYMWNQKKKKEIQMALYTKQK